MTGQKKDHCFGVVSGATSYPAIFRAFFIAVFAATLMTGCMTTTIAQKTSGWNVESRSAKKPSKTRRAKIENPEPIGKSDQGRSEVPEEAFKIVASTAEKPTTTKAEPREQVRTDASFKMSNEAAVKKTAKEPVPPAGVPLGIGAVDRASRTNNEAHLIFDFPVTYNSRVRKWIKYFQTTGRPSFHRWLERSSRYIPRIQEEMKRANLPLDLAYVAMIESGFSSSASSHANALGMWQFIAPTGRRYGLSIDWWIDERRDFEKSTKAAISYMADLFEQFGSWYLVAASYNMGENGVRRLIKRHKTNSFWDLADRGALPEETRNYLPKMLAAMLIAKAPALYGFRGLEFQVPYAYDSLEVPGGTDLINLANYLGVSERALTELNPELLKAFIPREVKTHRIRIPKGSKIAVSLYVNGGNNERAIQ